MPITDNQIKQREVAKAKLAAYKQRIDKDIVGYKIATLAHWKQHYGTAATENLKAYLDILSRGGKRLRGALTMNAYELAGGKDEKLALAAARCIEAIHAYLLVVDDVADKSATRRGGQSAHVQLAQLHQKHAWHGDSAHYGEAQAVHSALAGAHLAIQEILNLPIKDDYRLKALSTLNQGLATTVAGQIRDIYNQAIQNIPESEVREVLTMKTAYYSFLNPLEFGLNLAGKTISDYPYLKTYAIHIGLGFQVVDDILGTFGDSKKSGKGTTDDLAEGKITVLVARALEKADKNQRRQLLEILGKSSVSAKEHELAKKILKDTGALNYSRQLAANQISAALAALKTAPPSFKADFLAGLAAYILARNN